MPQPYGKGESQKAYENWDKREREKRVRLIFFSMSNFFALSIFFAPFLLLYQPRAIPSKTKSDNVFLQFSRVISMLAS
jgi:hypothetical protein